jgi:hypothetical protein
MPPPDLLFPKSPAPNPFPQSLLSLPDASSGYISRARTPFRLHPTLSQCQRSSRDATASLELYHATTVRHSELHAVFGPTPSPFPTLVSSPYFPLHPCVFRSLNSALNREIAISGHGATTEVAVASLCWLDATARLFPIQSDPSILNLTAKIRRYRFAYRFC